MGECHSEQVDSATLPMDGGGARSLSDTFLGREGGRGLVTDFQNI